MNFPSKATLATAFGSDKARMIRDAYNQARNGSYTEPTYRAKMELLNKIDVILQSHGVEHISAGRGANSPAIDYCNMGDTYDATVLYVHGKGFKVANWGTYVERGNYE